MPIGLMSAKGRDTLLGLGEAAFGVDFWILRGEMACDPGRLAVTQEMNGILDRRRFRRTSSGAMAQLILWLCCCVFVVNAKECGKDCECIVDGNNKATAVCYGAWL